MSALIYPAFDESETVWEDWTVMSSLFWDEPREDIKPYPMSNKPINASDKIRRFFLQKAKILSAKI